MSESDEFDVVEDDFEAGFNYSIDKASLRQGAEARLYECVYLGRPAMIKERFSKKYRHEILDSRLNKLRLKAELKGIQRAGSIGVASPTVYFVDETNNRIIMERIVGCTAKQWIETERTTKNSEEYVEASSSLGYRIGECVGKMHSVNLVHGDLTTSNIMLRDGNPAKLVFIDFGLCNLGKVNPEEKGVDLYVLERAIQSTHLDSNHIMESIMKGYASVNGKQGEAVGKKLDEIRLRGRKREMLG